MLEVKITIGAEPGLLKALEAFTAAMTGAAPAEKPKGSKSIPLGEQPKPEANSSAASEAKVTIEDIRAEVKVKAKVDKDAVKKLLLEFGADSVTALKAEHYEAFFAKIKAA